GGDRRDGRVPGVAALHPGARGRVRVLDAGDPGRAQRPRARPLALQRAPSAPARVRPVGAGARRPSIRAAREQALSRDAARAELRDRRGARVTRARWAVFAYHTFGARALEALVARGEDVALVVTHPDDPSESAWFESVAEIACIHRIPCLAPPAPNLPAVVEAPRPLAPAFILSVRYRRLLGPDLLTLPRVAALNLHGSLLPAYRGRAPLNWVLVNGEARTGVTLHHMTTVADAGDIVAQRPIAIEPDDTAFTLYE